jgi:hypothetical protein
MSKKIVKADPMLYGHLMLEFEDGSKQSVFRGEHEGFAPKPGDSWPPAVSAEAPKPDPAPADPPAPEPASEPEQPAPAAEPVQPAPAAEETKAQ